eukprot:1873442-Alexandrium_andersonii.AAC.1
MATLLFWTASALAGACAGNSMSTGSLNRTVEECALAASMDARGPLLRRPFVPALVAAAWGCSTQTGPTGVGTSDQSIEEWAFGLL